MASDERSLTKYNSELPFFEGNRHRVRHHLRFIQGLIDGTSGDLLDPSEILLPEVVYQNILF